MYNWEKSVREDGLRKTHQNPSFSSTLLEEIYRSIDGGDKKLKELKLYEDRTSKKQSNGVKPKTSTIGDEDTASLRRACRVEKWMQKKVNEKVSTTRKPHPMHELDRKPPLDNDPLFFSSSSISSDSSFGGFSSSETESFGPVNSTTSCSSVSNLKPRPIRTTVSASSENSTRASLYNNGEFLDDYNNHHQQENNDDSRNEESIIKSKSRALKIYANLKKVKQPISPGGRLSSFINSLFSNGNSKKKTTKSSSSVVDYDFETRTTKSTQGSSSTCSSASSYYKSCLSKNSPKSREKLNNGVKRTVKFFPVSVIIDEDCRPCGHKPTYLEDDSARFGKSQIKSNKEEREFAKSQIKSNREEHRSNSQAVKDLLKGYQNQNKNEFMSRKKYLKDDDVDEDAESDSSSDLFELDHLAMIGEKSRYCEELPVYETTHFSTNRAIANGLRFVS